MKAIKITTDDLILAVDIQEPSLEGMQEQVAGHIEVVRPFGFTYLEVPDNKSLLMIVNEEGRCIGLPDNDIGSLLYNVNDSDDDWEPIVGDVLIMAEGFVDGEPDIVGLTDEQVQALFIELDKL